jgi:hypothetical protein
MPALHTKSMKLKPITRSAFFNPRAVTAFALCIVAGLLALFAVGAVPTPFGKARVDSQTRSAAAKSASDSRKSGTAPSKKKIAARGGAAKSISGGKSTSPRAGAQTLPFSNTDNRVTQQQNALGQTVYSISPSRFDISPPLSQLAKISVPEPTEEQLPEFELPPSRIPRSDKRDPVTQVAPAPRDLSRPSAPAAPATGFNFEAIAGSGSFPPDTNGSVGNDQYVETVNTRYQVWSLNRATKIATSILGPTNINTLWAGFGGACQSQNAGDPIVVYDKVANRWLISQFTSSAAAGVFYQCVAVSTTANATGTYARYAFAVPDGNGANGGDFGDYPHYGVWSDAYYVMAHNFDNAPGGFSFVAALFGAMDRTKMLAGNPTATWQVILDPLEGGHMPADLDGFAPPPGGAPGIFTSLHGDGMYLYRMKVDFTTPANTTKTLQAIMPIAPASAACGGGNCIPQPQSPFTIDSLADRLMFRLAYRNFIDHESLVVSHSVDPGIAGVVSGVRWYDFRISGQPNAVCSSYPCTYQQGTVADAPNGRSRWMSSISMDGAENIVVAYSATGTVEVTDAHSIRYTGRAKSDPLGTMTGPETIIFTGTRNIVNEPNVSPARWGDYTSTSIDPADDCTFWHANEYYALGGVDNSDWHTRIASAAFPAGTDAGQCQPTTCTSRPTSAPTIGTASIPGTNQIQITWTAIAPTPGSYAIERAVGAVGSEGLYQPLAFVPGSSTSFIDTTPQGGVTYTYRVIAASDTAGRCQALVRSAGVSATATGSCNLEPIFAGVTSATSLDGPACGITLNWSPGSSSCPLRQLKYNIYRGTVPDFVPSAGNRVASCVSGPSSYVDTNNLTSGNTYYYVVRAEDNSTGGAGACGGNEESNNVHIAGTAYGAGTQVATGTWVDGGGDATSFLRLNPAGTGNSDDAAWRFVRTADDAGANHTPGGAYAYRNAGPGPDAIYSSNVCAVAETPVLTAGSTTLNLTYWERHQFERGWDGIAIEYSRNGGAWTDLPAPSNLVSDGCMLTDVTTDYGALDCTGAPPINACGYLASKTVITGPPTIPDPGCAVPTGDLTAYGRRCHLLTGLVVGDTIQFRWRFTSDPGLEFKGFYLDDIAVTNIRLRNSCTTTLPTPVLTAAASRMTHGAAGPFDAPMPLDGSGVEPRNGSGSHTVVLSFNVPMQSGNATVTSGTGSVSSVSFSGNDMLVNLSGVADQQRLTITATNLTAVGGGVLPSASLTLGFLVGDTNGNGAVNASDVGQTKSQSGQNTTGSNFRNDVNVNGVINAADISLVKSRSGNALPP